MSIPIEAIALQRIMYWGYDASFGDYVSMSIDAAGRIQN